MPLVNMIQATVLCMDALKVSGYIMIGRYYYDLDHAVSLFYNPSKRQACSLALLDSDEVVYALYLPVHLLVGNYFPEASHVCCITVCGYVHFNEEGT